MCTALSNATLTGPSTLGKYVFEDDSSLTTVSIGPNLSDTGVRPFRGCDSISSIDTSSNPYYDYENGLLIRTNGGTTEIVECMESRKNIIDTTTNPSLASVTSIKDEAFMDCDGLKNVDLSEADLTTVPYRCFRDDDRLYEVTLGQNVNFIDEEAFYNNPILDSVTIPNGNVQIKNNAFSYDSSIPTKTGDDRVTLYVPENSNAIPFAQTHTTEVVYDDALPKRWKVYFYENSLFGYDEMKPVGYEWVLDGNRATAGSVEVPTHDGYTFTG